MNPFSVSSRPGAAGTTGFTPMATRQTSAVISMLDQLVTALKYMGIDEIYDTTFGADFTTIEAPLITVEITVAAVVSATIRKPIGFAAIAADNALDAPDRLLSLIHI